MNNNNGKQNFRKKNTNPPYDQRQAAIISEKRRIEKIRKRRLMKALVDKITAIAVLSFIGAAVCLFAIFGYIFFDYNKGPDIPDEPLKITANRATTVLDKDNFFYRNGEYYVSLTKLCEILDFTLHGNVRNMTLNVSDSQGAQFIIDTNCIKIGGNYSLLKNPSYFEKEQLFIPCSFFTENCNGFTAQFDKEGKTHGYNLIFSEDFSVKAKQKTETLSIPYGTAAHVLQNEKPDFIADLSDYEMYMNPENRDEYLVLINEHNLLSEDYIPSDLIDIVDTRRDRAKQKMRLYAAKALEALFIEMRTNGFNDVSVTSGYRSYDYQTTLLNNQIASLTPTYGDKAREKALTSVALPGGSEHQSGLCVDMHNLSAASTAFASKEAYKWLYENCAEFGFILRYPKDKTDITGIMFEPWHYRYVGRYHARKIMDQGLCLEEYMATIN